MKYYSTRLRYVLTLFNLTIGLVLLHLGVSASVLTIGLMDIFLGGANLFFAALNGFIVYNQITEMELS